MIIPSRRYLILTENTIKTVKIKKIIDECEGIKTLFFNIKNILKKDYIAPKSGQFVMIWVPGIDEIPMSISGYDDDGNWSISVKDVGECTNALINLKIGDFIGVRGPLGNFFEIPEDINKKIFLIAGGIGIAPLKCLVNELNEKKLHFTIIQGAKIEKELMINNNLQKLNEDKSHSIFCTDDGSYGLEGFASDIFNKILKDISVKEISKSLVYTCGPESMMYKIFQTCERYHIQLQASLERVMRCGCGLCGLCALDPLGLLVCKDGPVFKSEILRKIDDFGKFKRDFTGRKIPLY
jgi:dihydroorotate dehydrogenase electron transfer subunit